VSSRATGVRIRNDPRLVRRPHRRAGARCFHAAEPGPGRRRATESPLLLVRKVSTNRAIHHRLLTVLLLGVLTSALSLVALVQLLSTSTAQRIERAREGVIDEADRLARDPSLVTDPNAAHIIGMRGGVRTEAIEPPGLPEPWHDTLRGVLRGAIEGRTSVVREARIGDSTLVVAARPAPSVGGVAWAGFMVKPLPWIRTWQWIVSLLAGATALLFASAVHAIATMKRGAAAIHGSLNALATNLSAPITRPTVREFSDIADGIAELASRLARARREEDRLGRELARQERLAALGRVVAGVAHEVRNPLASIKLRLDLAAASARLPQVADKAITHASSEIARLDRLVADLLVVAGRASGPKSESSVGRLLRARAESLAPWAAERGVAIAVSGDATAFIDCDSIARAIDNLLRNAVEASPRDRTVEASVDARADSVTIRVDDEGVGVEQARAAELFEPFFTTKADGTGLGLAICRAIAQTHGGHVSYARRDGKTRFELTLARSPHAPPAEAAA